MKDDMILKCALNVYARHLRGFKDGRFSDDLKRVELLQTKPIKSNSIAVTINLEV